MIRPLSVGLAWVKGGLVPQGPVRLRFVSLVSVVAVLASYLTLAVAPTASAVPSADASAVAFTVNSGGVSSIWTMAPDGTNPVEVPGQPADSNTAPAISPDGTQVAFTSTPSGGTSDIWVMDVAGGGLTQVTSDPGNDSNPAWSSDGKTVAFQSDRSGNLDIWLMNPDGSSQSDLTGSSSATDSQPAWFPGLRRIAFVSTRSGHADIWAVNGSGTRLTHVTSTNDSDTQPTVDPAGKLIAFTSRHAGNYDIYTVPVDGGTITRVTTPAGIDSEPAFSTDGRYLTFTSDRSGLAQVWRMPRPSGTAVQLTNGVDPAGGSEWIPYTYPTPTWASRYSKSSYHVVPWAMTSAPDGSKVFVAGAEYTANKGYPRHSSILAYSSAGALLWSHEFGGTTYGYTESFAVAVSPDGSKVYVAGWSDFDLYVISYSTSTGTFLAQRDYYDHAPLTIVWSLIVSPDSSKVYVAGTDYNANGDPTRSVTMGLSSALSVNWTAHQTATDPTQGAIQISPDGGMLYWSGIQYGSPVTDYHKNNYVTNAYYSVNGLLKWSKTYNSPAHDEDDAFALAMSPDGGTLYTTGWSVGGATSKADAATVAYAAADGTQKWVSRYDSPNHGWDWATSLAVSPDGSTLYAGGARSRNVGSKLTYDLLTTSLDTSDGSVNWASMYNGPGDYTGNNGNDVVMDTQVTPDGSHVVVSGRSLRTGSSFDMTSLAYDTSGVRTWLARYNGPANVWDGVESGVLSPDGSTLYVTGESDSATLAETATVAWDVSSIAPIRPARVDASARAAGDDGSVVTAVARPSAHQFRPAFRAGLSKWLHSVRRL
jgi:WD40-like Beta Propeller Repeat